MRIWKRVSFLLLTVVITCYLCLAALAFFSDRILFQPQLASYRDSEFQFHSENAQVVKVRSQSRGVDTAIITALYLPNPQATYTLLFSHGNAEDLGDDLPILEMLHDAGFAVFAYDYRGYGTSQGHSSEKSVYADADAAYEYLTQQLKVPADRIISMGRSLGSAAAVELAASHQVAALILEAPFVSAFRVLTRVKLLPWDKFENLEKIHRIHVPVLVIQGRNDRVVPFRHGQRIYSEANPPKQFLWVDHAGHNDVVFVAGPAYFNALRKFAGSL